VRPELSKKQKELERLLSKPKDLRFEELQRVLIHCDYVLDRMRGSHAIFVHPELVSLTIPAKTPVKSYLIEQVLDVIEEYIED